MSAVSAKDLLASLGRARDMGLVEEAFDLCGHSLVVRNLRPLEIEAVLYACKGMEDLSYVHAYQREHIARGICEIDGFDLREVEFIDDEEPDPKRQGQMRKVRVERHKWIAANLIATWSSEAVLSAYRKIGDCTMRAEKLSKEGITFLADDESNEDKYRKLLGEIKELEEDMPPTLIDRTLEEFGYARRSTLEELKAADERLNRLREEESNSEASPEAPPEPEPQPEPEPEPPSPVAQAKDIMAKRKPLNQEEAPPPELPRQAPVVPVQPVIPARAPVSSRAAQLAALEADADMMGLMGEQAPPQGVQRPTEVAELTANRPRVDPQQVAGLIDPPPPAGINPRFRPPPR